MCTNFCPLCLRLITDLIYPLTRTVNVVTNAKKIKFGMIIGVILVKLIIMVIFVLKMEELVQARTPYDMD